MALFSERNGYLKKPLQIDSVSDDLRNRIWNTYSCEISFENYNEHTNHLEGIMDACGLAFCGPRSMMNLQKDLEILREWFMKAEWYKVFDFVEIYLDFLPKRRRESTSTDFNSVFVAENSGYRIVGNHVVPITNPDEIACIEQAEQTKLSNVNIHIQKAIELISRRPLPDYENSIKESISAVEALCCIITGQTGSNATLGQTLNKLKESGIYIHPAMIKAFIALYGYTSDENGIRHGGIDFIDAPYEDAKYMLVSCSAFVNYLIEKWSKVNQTDK